MTEIQKYNEVFISSLSIDEKQLSDKLAYNQIQSWDSIGHMTLISSLEEKFKITFEVDDIVNFSSYGKGKDILKKYGIKLS